jgi:hypothetical protein
LLFFFVVSRCFSLLSLAVFCCYFGAAIAKNRGIPRLSLTGPLFFRGKQRKKAAARGGGGLAVSSPSQF